MSTLSNIGASTLGAMRSLNYLAATAGTVVLRSILPGTWRKTLREVLARQMLFTGVEAASFVALIAAMVGLSVVVQAQVWLARVGQSELMGPMLVAVIIREVGPLVTNFVVIGRSGAAIASELASMRVAGEVRVLDAQGLDPFLYLVLPRAVGVALSVFCLTIIFIVVSFATGFVSAVLLGAQTGGPSVFLHSVFSAVQPADLINVLVKTLIPGVLTGVICCAEGLAVRGALTEIPQATTRGLVRSVAALFITSALVSLLTYF